MNYYFEINNPVIGMPAEADLIHQTFDSSPHVLDNRNISTSLSQ